MFPTQEECARELLDVVPLVTRAIRREMRQNRTEGLSVPQFRTLFFIRRNPGTSLIDVADHLGLTPPSTSKLIDLLLGRELLVRKSCVQDRRRVSMYLTPKGEQCLDCVDHFTLENMTKRIELLSNNQLEILDQAMKILKEAFPESESSSERKQCTKMPQIDLTN